MDKTDKRIGWALFAFVLLAMLIFFERAHPLVVLDVDDWTYICTSRVALPSRRFWNPARILPEILMPYAAELAVLVFRPLGFIPAITAMNGLVLSLTIAWYVLCLHRLLTERVKLGAAASALLSLVFLLLHFLLFRTEMSNNDYLFRAKDVTCVYYYTIPGMLNCGLVLRLLRTGENRRFLEPGAPLRKGVLAAAAYLAVFSNLYESALLTAYCGLDLLRGCFGAGREKGRALLKSQAFNLAVLLLWAVSAWMEAGGERAAYASSLPFFTAVLLCARAFALRVLTMNRVFLLLAGCALASGLFFAVRGRRKDADFGCLFGVLAALTLLCAGFEILLCAKVRIDYVTRSDALFVVYAALLTLVTVSLALLLREKERLRIGLPLLLVILYSLTNTGLRTFMESNDLYAPAWVCTALSEELVEQIRTADRAGEDTVTIRVFDSGSEDNWPQTLYMGPRIAAALYKHGVTEKLMTVYVVRDPELNRRYHVAEP